MSPLKIFQQLGFLTLFCRCLCDQFGVFYWIPFLLRCWMICRKHARWRHETFSTWLLLSRELYIFGNRPTALRVMGWLLVVWWNRKYPQESIDLIDPSSWAQPLTLFPCSEGAELNARAMGNETPLWYAACSGCERKVNLLLEAGRIELLLIISWVADYSSPVPAKLLRKLTHLGIRHARCLTK